MLIKYIHMRCKRTKEGNFETQKQHSVKFYYCFDIIFIPYSPRPNGPMGSLVLYKSNCIYNSTSSMARKDGTSRKGSGVEGGYSRSVFIQ